MNTSVIYYIKSQNIIIIMELLLQLIFFHTIANFPEDYGRNRHPKYTDTTDGGGMS